MPKAEYNQRHNNNFQSEEGVEVENPFERTVMRESASLQNMTTDKKNMDTTEE